MRQVKKSVNISQPGVERASTVFMKKFFILAVLAAAFFLARPVLAAETIDDFSVTIKINPGSSIDVTEQITYDFGAEQKHGIYRNIPVKYKTKAGNLKLRLDVISVDDGAGHPYRYEVINKGNDKSVKIGDPDVYVTGKKKYVLHYIVKGAINHFADHDELYWNATGNEWSAVIAQAKATVILPQAVSAGDLKSDCYAGPPGSADPCVSDRFVYSGPDTVEKIVYTNDRLNSGEGLTVVAGFPVGLVAYPSAFEKVMNVLRDNWILGLPFLTFIVLYYLWRTRGRDPRGRGTIIAQYDSPDGLSPVEVGTIIDERAEGKDLSAEIINLAVAGYLKIERLEKGAILKSSDYELTKLKDSDAPTNNLDGKLLAALFSSGKTTVRISELKDKFYKDWEKIKKDVYTAVVAKGYFPKSPAKVRGIYAGVGILIPFLVAVAGSAIFGMTIGAYSVGSLAIMGLLIVIFGIFMPAKTAKGVAAKEYILGLKRYLVVAEKDRINFHNAPDKNPKRFEKLLPYAMVLGVEKEWAKQFEGIYNQEPSWYHDPSGGAFSAMIFANNLGSFRSSANSALASRPASSGGSGLGGGGFSGGGFGGGGGGSW